MAAPIRPKAPKQMAVTLDDATRAKVIFAAQRKGVSLSQYMREAIEAYVREDEAVARLVGGAKRTLNNE